MATEEPDTGVDHRRKCDRRDEEDPGAQRVADTAAGDESRLRPLNVGCERVEVAGRHNVGGTGDAHTRHGSGACVDDAASKEPVVHGVPPREGRKPAEDDPAHRRDQDPRRAQGCHIKAWSILKHGPQPPDLGPVIAVTAATADEPRDADRTEGQDDLSHENGECTVGQTQQTKPSHGDRDQAKSQYG